MGVFSWCVGWADKKNPLLRLSLKSKLFATFAARFPPSFPLALLARTFSYSLEIHNDGEHGCRDPRLVQGTSYANARSGRRLCGERTVPS